MKLANRKQWKRSRPLSAVRQIRALLKPGPTICMPNMPVRYWASWTMWNFIFLPEHTSSMCVPPRAWATATSASTANASKPFVHDSSSPEREETSGPAIDLTEDVRPWWKRSPSLAASAGLAIGLATWWFGNMMGRVPLDGQSTLGYLLMLPLLLIVPAFSAAGIRLAWLAWSRGRPLRSCLGWWDLVELGGNLGGLAGLQGRWW